MTREQFEALLDAGEIYEYQQIHDGSYYGGSRQVLKKHLESGKILIKDIDVLGAETYKREIGSITKIISLFLCVDDVNTLLERMRGRGDTEESIQQRAKRSSGCVMPSEEDILGCADKDCRVELCYNGKELLITEGAAGYARSKRNGSFIQKHVASQPDFSCLTKNEQWNILLDKAE